MTRPKTSRFFLSSFSPELMTILLKGARERVEIPCPDQRTMKFLQMRLQMLRGAMGRENHPQYRLATRARTTRTWHPDDKDRDCVLVVQPNDIQFSDMIRKAGITVDEIKHAGDILDDITADPEPSPEAKEHEGDPVFDPYAKFKGGG